MEELEEKIQEILGRNNLDEQNVKDNIKKMVEESPAIEKLEEMIKQESQKIK